MNGMFGVPSQSLQFDQNHAASLLIRALSQKSRVKTKHDRVFNICMPFAVAMLQRVSQNRTWHFGERITSISHPRCDPGPKGSEARKEEYEKRKMDAEPDMVRVHSEDERY